MSALIHLFYWGIIGFFIAFLILVAFMIAMAHAETEEKERIKKQKDKEINK
jgi:predicted PurR-regulated permease PerM